MQNLGFQGGGYRYLQKLELGKYRCFSVQNPIWRLDSQMKKLGFRFSAKFYASHWLAIFFD